MNFTPLPEHLTTPTAATYTPPTPTELRTFLCTITCSQLEAARMIGVDGRTVRRWVGGSASPSFSQWFTLYTLSTQDSSSARE